MESIFVKIKNNNVLFIYYYYFYEELRAKNSQLQTEVRVRDRRIYSTVFIHINFAPKRAKTKMK